MSPQVTAAIVAGGVALVGVAVTYVSTRRQLKATREEIHDEVNRDLVSRRIDPYVQFMSQLAPLSRRREEALRENRREVSELADVFQAAIYGPVGVLASNDTREIIVSCRAACLQFAAWELPLDRLLKRVWALHQGLRSDLGVAQPGWQNEIERRRLGLMANDANDVERIIESARHVTYELYDLERPVLRLEGDRQISALVLDMDGLMLDSEVVERKAWQHAASDFGLSLSDDEFLRLVGSTGPDTRAILSSLWSKPSGAPVGVDQVARRQAQYLEGVSIPAKEGMTELVKWARRNRFPVGVASSSVRPKVMHRLEPSRVLVDIDVVVGGDEIERGKPDPDIFLTAARRLGEPPGRCLFMEDSDSGITAAVRAGMTAVLVPDNSIERTVPAEIASSAYRVVKSLHEVLDLVSGNR